MKPISDNGPNRVPMIAVTGEIIYTNELLFLELAANSINAVLQQRRYQIVVDQVSQVTDYGILLPRFKRRMKITGDWVKDPTDDLSELTEEASQWKRELNDIGHELVNLYERP